jgi:hypothetical protein
MSPDFPTSQPDQRLGLHGLPRAIRTREVLPEKFLLALPVLRAPACFGAQRATGFPKSTHGLAIARELVLILRRLLPNVNVGGFRLGDEG